MPLYNKLVRDRIPEIIKSTGKKYNTTILDDARYIKELQDKLKEEVQEYFYSTSNPERLEELADILEVVYSLAHSHGYSKEQLEQRRQQKEEEKGSFKDKMFLIEVED